MAAWGGGNATSSRNAPWTRTRHSSGRSESRRANGKYGGRGPSGPRFHVLYWEGGDPDGISFDERTQGRGMHRNAPGGPSLCNQCGGVWRAWRHRLDNMQACVRACGYEKGIFRPDISDFVCLSPRLAISYSLGAFSEFLVRTNMKALCEDVVLGLPMRVSRGEYTAGESGVEVVHLQTETEKLKAWLSDYLSNIRKAAEWERGRSVALLLDPDGVELFHLDLGLPRRPDFDTKRGHIASMLILLGGPKGIDRENERFITGLLENAGFEIARVRLPGGLQHSNVVLADIFMTHVRNTLIPAVDQLLQWGPECYVQWHLVAQGLLKRVFEKTSGFQQTMSRMKSLTTLLNQRTPPAAAESTTAPSRPSGGVAPPLEKNDSKQTEEHVVTEEEAHTCAIVIRAFHAADETETDDGYVYLDVKEGEHVVILPTPADDEGAEDDGWTVVRNHAGQEGWIPMDLLKVIEVEGTDSTAGQRPVSAVGEKPLLRQAAQIQESGDVNGKDILKMIQAAGTEPTAAQAAVSGQRTWTGQTVPTPESGNVNGKDLLKLIQVAVNDSTAPPLADSGAGERPLPERGNADGNACGADGLSAARTGSWREPRAGAQVQASTSNEMNIDRLTADYASRVKASINAPLDKPHYSTSSVSEAYMNSETKAGSTGERHSAPKAAPKTAERRYAAEKKNGTSAKDHTANGHAAEKKNGISAKDHTATGKQFNTRSSTKVGKAPGVDEFVSSWGLNDDSKRTLLKLSVDWQEYAMDKFYPSRHTRDINGVFIMFCCRSCQPSGRDSATLKQSEAYYPKTAEWGSCPTEAGKNREQQNQDAEAKSTVNTSVWARSVDDPPIVSAPLSETEKEKWPELGVQLASKAKKHPTKT